MSVDARAGRVERCVKIEERRNYGSTVREKTSLLIISHTPHYQRDGQTVGWGPTVREIDQLTRLFDRITHLAPLYSGPAPESSLGYGSSNVLLHPIRPAGGDCWHDKLRILITVPSYIRAIARTVPLADVVHIRCPANISCIALIYLWLTRYRKRKWVKYAGNWQPERQPDPISYRFQRWWLKRMVHDGFVTINGRWPNQPAHLHTFDNPCLTQAELNDARLMNGKKQLERPVRLLYAGRLDDRKGVDKVIQIIYQLQSKSIPSTLDLVGDGPDRGRYEEEVERLELTHVVKFHGWLPQPDLAPIYSRSHIFVLPSESEGWPKVISEGMAYGVVPVVNAIPAIRQTLVEIGTGVCVINNSVSEYVSAITDLVDNPRKWKEFSRAGMDGACRFGFEQYIEQIESCFCNDV